MRKAAAAASPVKISGVAKTRVEVRAPFARMAASNILRYVLTGLCPVAARTMAIAAKANASEPRGTATDSHRGCSRRRSILTTASGHEIADLVDGRAARVQLTDDLTLVHDDDSVGEGADLVEILADEKDGHTAVGRIAEVRVHGLDGA